MSTEVTIARKSAGSTAGRSGRHTEVYIVQGVETPEAAYNTTGIPSIGDTLAADTRKKVTNKSAKRISEHRADTWEVTVTFEHKDDDWPDDPEDGDEYWTISSSLESITRKTANAQTGYGVYKRDVGKSVGVTQDGAVEGGPWFAPTAKLDVTLWKSAAEITDAYITGCLGEMGRVNSGSWYGFSAGEVLFAGFSIPKRGDDIWEIQFSFEIRPNEATADLPSYPDYGGGTITYEAGLKGWEYAWIDEVTADDTDDVKMLVRGLYVAQFYETSDFSALDLSGSTGLDAS